MEKLFQTLSAGLREKNKYQSLAHTASLTVHSNCLSKYLTTLAHSFVISTISICWFFIAFERKRTIIGSGIRADIVKVEWMKNHSRREELAHKKYKNVEAHSTIKQDEEVDLRWQSQHAHEEVEAQHTQKKMLKAKVFLHRRLLGIFGAALSYKSAFESLCRSALCCHFSSVINVSPKKLNSKER